MLLIKAAETCIQVTATVRVIWRADNGLSSELVYIVDSLDTIIRLGLECGKSQDCQRSTVRDRMWRHLSLLGRMSSHCLHVMYLMETDTPISSGLSLSPSVQQPTRRFGLTLSAPLYLASDLPMSGAPGAVWSLSPHNPSTSWL